MNVASSTDSQDLSLVNLTISTDCYQLMNQEYIQN